MHSALVCQLLLLLYHQATTFFDLFPFNGARNYTRQERWAEMGTNAVLMGLAPIGFLFDIHALQVYGTYYYFVLFAIELTIWWIPYFCTPHGMWRRAYNVALALGTSNFGSADALSDWLTTHRRIHAGTWSLLPPKARRIVPNLEHTLLHAWTLVTAVVTSAAVHGQ